MNEQEDKTPAMLCCVRCGRSWNRRIWDRLPLVCPSCKSPYWNRIRLRARQ